MSHNPNMDFLTQIKNSVDSLQERLSWNEYFMSIAFLISSRSACSRLHVGCVIVKDTRILSVGYNGFLPGAPHTSRVIDNHEQSTVHAEQNAICHAASSGISVKGAVAYITHYPCINCCKILLSSGIEKIYYHHDYRNNPVVQELVKDINGCLVKI